MFMAPTFRSINELTKCGDGIKTDNETHKMVVIASVK